MDNEFLLAILASPADARLRRDYADALRESNPTQAEYIEREIVWADCRSHGALTALQVAGKGLDPVWLARVSRPPVGVCCDRFRLQHGAETSARQPLILTEGDLAWLETRFALTLPADYRAFLLNHNGGWPTCTLSISPEQKAAGCNEAVAYFCSIWATHESQIDWDVDLVWRLQQLEATVRHSDLSDAELSTLCDWEQAMARRWRRPPYANWMVIGAGAPTGDLEWFCLECRGLNLGRVYCVDVAPQSADDSDHCLLAPTFSEFVAHIGSGE